MAAVKTQNTLSEIERNMSELAPYRPPALFHEFLVQGYTAITLSCVPGHRFSDLLRAKLCLGTLITLYDDFADRPSQRDPQLLNALCQLRFGSQKFLPATHPRHRRAAEYAFTLFTEIDLILQRQPRYELFTEILNFDLSQFYAANQLSAALTALPPLGNKLESRLYAHHNMGMVMVGMMDLMAAENLKLPELGRMREIFLLGQRAGRIFNVLATHKREVADGDVTSELATCATEEELACAKSKLQREALLLRRKISGFERKITTFSVPGFVAGLIKVQKLHERMEGTI